jgi:hypothetical protein
MPSHLRWAALLLAAALSGCGGGDELNVGEVEGVVTLDGKPLPNAVVTFTPKAGGPSGVGKTDADGNYQLLTVNDLGAVVGEHTVSIVCVPAPGESNPSAGHGAEFEKAMAGRPDHNPPKPATKVPERYNTQSELVEQVEAGSNEINFDLKS